MTTATAIIKKSATNLQNGMQAAAKMSEKSVPFVRNGRTFDARMHGTKTRYYLDGELVTKQHQFDALCSAIAIETQKRDGSKIKVEAAKPGHAPMPVVIKKENDPMVGTVMHVPEASLRDFKQVIARVPREPVEMVMPRGTFAFPIRGGRQSKFLAKLKEYLNARERARKHVGKARDTQRVHKECIANQYYELCEYHSKPAKIKRAKRLAKVLRILSL